MDWPFAVSYGVADGLALCRFVWRREVCGDRDLNPACRHGFLEWVGNQVPPGSKRHGDRSARERSTRDVDTLGRLAAHEEAETLPERAALGEELESASKPELESASKPVPAGGLGGVVGELEQVGGRTRVRIDRESDEADSAGQSARNAVDVGFVHAKIDADRARALVDFACQHEVGPVALNATHFDCQPLGVRERGVLDVRPEGEVRHRDVSELPALPDHFHREADPRPAGLTPVPPGEPAIVP